MILFEQDHIKVYYQIENKQLIQQWSGFATSMEFREAIEVTIDFSRQYNVLSLICDLSDQQVVSMDNILYASQTFPKLFEHGVLAAAFIIPKNIFSQLSLKEFAKTQDSPKVQYFRCKKEAQKWITEKLQANP